MRQHKVTLQLRTLNRMLRLSSRKEATIEHIFFFRHENLPNVLRSQKKPRCSQH